MFDIRFLNQFCSFQIQHLESVLLSKEESLRHVQEAHEQTVTKVSFIMQWNVQHSAKNYGYTEPILEVYLIIRKASIAFEVNLSQSEQRKLTWFNFRLAFHVPGGVDVLSL